jgi:hypothetical protein
MEMFRQLTKPEKLDQKNATSTVALTATGLPSLFPGSNLHF